MAENFALIGASAYVAPLHLRAIRETGNRLVAAADPHDSVGVLDRYFPEAGFFTEIERFDRHLEKRRLGSAGERVGFVSICSPNYLHDAHVRLALRIGAHAICEKPLVVNPWNLSPLEELEAESGRRVWTILQLRHHPALESLRARLDLPGASRRAEVCVTYVTPRGPWYQVSWKGSAEKSGGLAMNIGVHLFDLLLWLFGPAERLAVHLAEPRRMSGVLELARARASWFLSLEASDLPPALQAARAPHRVFAVDGETFDLSSGLEALHTRCYEEILAGRGLGIGEARPSIELVHAIRSRAPDPPGRDAHPFLTR